MFRRHRERLRREAALLRHLDSQPHDCRFGSGLPRPVRHPDRRAHSLRDDRPDYLHDLGALSWPETGAALRERGVRVRLLPDENGIPGLRTILSALDRHPNIEIHRCNTFPIRFPKAFGPDRRPALEPAHAQQEPDGRGGGDPDQQLRGGRRRPPSRGLCALPAATACGRRTETGTGRGRAAEACRSGASTLHAKTFTVDHKRLFVGFFNLDPRSVRLNTELGFVIESLRLAAR